MCCFTDNTGGSELQNRLLNELSMVKGAATTEDRFCASITIPITEDLHLRRFPPLDSAHKLLDFACFRNSVSLSLQQEVMLCCVSCFLFCLRCLPDDCLNNMFMSNLLTFIDKDS